MIILYNILLILLYIFYLKYHNTSIFKDLFKSKETFKNTKDEIAELTNSVKLLRENIIDLASVAKHNTMNVCKINKSIEEVKYHSEYDN